MEIRFDKVSYVYNQKSQQQTRALTDISFTLEKRKINGITGVSGSGKTTMLELINGLLLPTDGIVTIGKAQLKRKTSSKTINSLRSLIGLVFQCPEEQFFNTTVEKEIAFALRKFKYKKDVIKKRVREALLMVGLNDHYLNLNPFNLSNGEKRKIALASVLIFNPKVIVLDEPTAALDYKGKQMLIKNLRLLRDRYHKTIIISSHDIDLLYQIADYLVILDKGNLISAGKKEVIYNLPSISNNDYLRKPRIALFIQKAKKKKGITLGNHIDIKDLIKDVYRNV